MNVMDKIKFDQIDIQNNSLKKKLVLGTASAISVAAIGSAGFAAAQTPNPANPTSTPAVVAYCKTHYKQLGYANIGQCVSHLNGHGHGYGG